MFRRVLIALAAASGVLVLAALPAAAHIEVDPSSATAGSSTLLTFRVPNEMDNADTVGLKIKMPTDHPLASVSVQPKAGWTITTKTAKPSKPLSGDNGPVDTIVTEVDWSGGKIPPGQFDTFELSIDPLPDVAAALVFPTIQTYKDADGQDLHGGLDPDLDPGGGRARASRTDVAARVSRFDHDRGDRAMPPPPPRRRRARRP